MSGMQKPFSSEGRKPESPAAPPAPERKKGGFFRKLFKTVVLLAVLATIGSMVWHGMKLGEERAVEKWKQNPAGRTEQQARAESSLVPPWQWTTVEWEGWWMTVRSLGSRAGAKIAAQTAALREYASERWKAMSAAAASDPAGAHPAGATGDAPRAPAAPPTASGTPAAPAKLGLDFDRAIALLKEGEALWMQNDLRGARPKMEEAVRLLSELKERHPADGRVEKAHRLASDYLDNINSRDF